MAGQTVDPFAVEDPSELPDWRLPLSFMKSRHSSLATSEDDGKGDQAWRMKDRMKTWSVALVLCLNIGVDPPDVVKTSPCARKECWIDSMSTSPQKALEEIGNSLQKQYERWQPRARYKQLLDPTTDDVKKLCVALRKNAKSERVLFHYNGHGVPRPTQNGEIWVFNKNYTQYIPLSIYDLQAWMGSPSIYVYDCSHAGLILESFKAFARQRDSEFFLENTAVTNCVGLLENCIQLAACGPKEVLPMHPSLPADLFTSCLTTPIKTALLWYCYSRVGKLSLVADITPDIIDKIPGRINDRRTPLGELNWIFTAITDTIAWNTVPKDLFQKLFRQDLLVASLFRNFLLAERIMRSYKCTPESHPQIPSTYNHPMWQAWDLTLDHIVRQLPALVENKAPYESSKFFAQQLAAFQVWLINCSQSTTPPQQLPIVLQFLLSQAHRLQALELLGRFLDLGPWAVHAALNVGIFPYVLKLLGSKLKELQPILVFIWAKILAVDSSCQADLIKDGGYKYFIQILADQTMQYEYRTMAAFVLSVIVNNNTKGQEVALQNNVISLCLSQLEEPNPLLKQWLAICLGRLWCRYDSARWCGVRDSAHEKLYQLLAHDIPDVRAAGVYALGTYMLNSSEGGSTELASSIDHSVGSTLMALLNDGSPVVRLELVSALHSLIQLYEKQFQMAALRSTEGDRMINLSTSLTPTGWIHVSIDPPEVETSFEAEQPHQVPTPAKATPSIGSKATPSKATPSIGASRQISARTSATIPNGSLVESPPHHASFSSGSSVGSEDVLGRKSYGSPRTASTVSSKSVHAQIWKGLVLLASDPCPRVAEHAQYIVHSVHDKLRQKSLARSIGVTLVNSMSAPSSPNKDTKSATLGPSSVRPTQRPVLSTSSSTQEFRGDPGISLPRQMSAATMSLPAGTMQLAARRRVFGRGNAPVTEEDDEGVEDLSMMETRFCDWCCKYFANPLMKQPEDCDPASMPYQEREFRFIRNHTIRKDAQEVCRLGSKGKLSDQVFVNKETSTPHLLLFHPYLPQLAVMSKQSWSVWEVEDGHKMSSNYNSPSQITAAKFINPHDITHLLIGSEDGAVHVWKDYSSPRPKLVTSWRALTDMLPSSRSAGMVLEWEQASGLLYAAGDSRHIKVWDTHKELNVQDMPTGADSCVSCLTSDIAQRSLLIAGCGDGTVRLYDRRQAANRSLVQTLREHKSWVFNVHMQLYSKDRYIVTCSVDGDIRVWDPRFSQSVKSIPGAPGSANVCEIHPKAPLLACASQQQGIRIHNLDTEEVLNHIRYHDGFMGQKIGPTRCLAFHPYKVWLAAGGSDGLITVYSTDRKK